MITGQARVTDPLMAQCWPSFYNAGTTLTHQWLNASCLRENSATGTVKAAFLQLFYLPHFAIYITVCDD